MAAVPNSTSPSPLSSRLEDAGAWLAGRGGCTTAPRPASPCTARYGPTDFLVVRSITLLRERGVEGRSLNFGAFARWRAARRAASSARSRA